jgi:hypothetical protein
VIGKVKWFSLQRGFGFGAREDESKNEDPKEEFFMHRVRYSRALVFFMSFYRPLC